MNRTCGTYRLLWANLALLGCAGCQTMRGEPWTIECLELSGPDHQAHATAIADVLRSTDGIDAEEVEVRHGDDGSRVYYGRYLRRIDRLRGIRDIPEDLKRDLEMIKELYDDRGRRIFLGARMVPMPIEDKGPPEWNLENVEGEYSLQVAVFFATPEVPDFKQAAVSCARQLRQEGYAAYYHHGRSKSIVTVGVFGPDAVVRRGNVIDYSDEVRALQRQENFAYNLTNGAVWTAFVDGEQAPVRSLLVRIPKSRDQDS